MATGNSYLCCELLQREEQLLKMSRIISLLGLTSHDTPHLLNFFLLQRYSCIFVQEDIQPLKPWD